MSLDDLTKIAEAGEIEIDQLNQQEVVYSAGDVADKLYIVISGIFRSLSSEIVQVEARWLV